MPKFITTTLGCKVNQCESESMAKSLISSGWTFSREKTGADLCIINTCAVTGRASMQSRQAIRKTIRSNPGAYIIVTGCCADTEDEELKKIDGISRIMVNNEKENLCGIINREKGIRNCFSGPIDTPLLHFGNRTRAFLKIQDGCDSFCTYCIVPYARGRSRSLPVRSVIDNANSLWQAGYREIVLSGIHLGKYGRDLFPETSLASLLQQLNEYCFIERVRLSSVEPDEITPSIIKIAAESGKICRHFHVPLQSGDDTILESMRRPYTRGFFRDLVLGIKGSIPDAAIGADVLVGFPGETEEAFQNTYSLIEELPLTYLHVFPFSPRRRTPAFHFPEKVPAGVIKERCIKIRNLGASKKGVFYRKSEGTETDILIEDKRDYKSGLLKGLSSNYIPVLVGGEDRIRNSIVRVRIDKSFENHVTGQIIKP
jgi:threonylcarbamoyladenosine tRNA methylthiotransferase MtaB